MSKSSKILKYQYIYILILCVLTNDFFEFTSIKDWITPEFINYKLYSFYFSFLYIPIIIYGVYCYFKNNNKMQTNLFAFILLVFLKDLLLYYYNGGSYLFSNLSFELYMQYIISFCMIIIIFSYKDNVDSIMKFYETFMSINILMLIVSLITGIGTGLYGFEKRYHSSNLTHGETGVLLGMFSIYLLCYKKSKYSNLYGIFTIIMVLATGSRKDLLYIVIVYFVYSIINFFKNPIKKVKFNNKQFVIGYFIVITAIMLLIFSKNIITEKLDIERMFSAIFGIFKGGTEFITNDYSGKGRIDSIVSSVNLLKNNVLGLSFSFFDAQFNMQLNNYPTFPHVTLIFYYLILGPLLIIPLISYIKIFFKLIKIKNNYSYIIGYFFIYNTLSGGALLNFKSLLMNILILWTGMKLIKENNKSLKRDKYKIS